MWCCKRQNQTKVTPTVSISALLSSQELKKLLLSSPSEISILEADIGKASESDFKAGHIPKARHFDQLECTTPTEFIPRGLPDVKCFEDYLTRLGVSNDDHIILYDRSPTGFLASSRAWVVLKAYGAKNLSILNGGFHGWVKEINEIETSENNDSKQQKKKFTVTLNTKMIQNFDQMLANFSSNTTNTQRIQVVDARPPNLFNGVDAGHMPGALSLPHGTVLDQTNQCLKSINQLEELFKTAGIDLSKPAIYTCHTGTTASTLAFVAHLLGQKDLSVYIGAFTEWQQRAPTEMIIKGGDNTTVN